MSKYVGGLPTLQPKENTFGKVVENISNDMKMQAAQRVINDPNATPIQQAMALASINQEKLGTEVFKKAANQSTLAGIEERLSQNLGIAPPPPVEAPRDRSWRDQAISGMTPPIRDASQDTVAQPGAEGAGSPTQPGFSVNGPQNASRNSTALNQQAPNPNMAGGLPQVAPQATATPQVDPEREAAAYEQAAQEAARAGNHPVATQYANKAKEIRKDVRQDKKFAHGVEREIISDEKDIRKETAPYIEGVVNAYKGKKNQEAILNQMENLASSKELTTPLMHSLLGAAGLPLGVLNNPDSEEFEKLSNNLTRDITKFYGARINQTEFINFLKQIPTLSNSEEGRLRVTKNLKRMLEPVELEYKIMSDMLSKNNGKPFPNMNFYVTQKMEPILDEWASEINTDMKKGNDISTPLAPDEVIMKFNNPDGSTVRKRVSKSDVGKWLQWGTIE